MMIGLKPQGHLSNMARREKWEIKKKPPKRKQKNFLYFSDFVDAREPFRGENYLINDINSCEFIIDDENCLNSGTENVSDYNLISLVTLEGWALPLQNDLNKIIHISYVPIRIQCF